MPIKVRISLPKISGQFPDFAASWLGAPMLVSANSLFDHKHKRFRKFEWKRSTFYGDLALDSAGYVAMSLYGGYPWSVDDYVEMMAIGSGISDERNRTGPSFAWWAAMDLCCEPDIAIGRQGVRDRVKGTVDLWEQTVEIVRYWRDYEGANWLTMPMPTIQGWTPSDYVYCLELYAMAFDRLKKTRMDSLFADQGDEFPGLMGVGSVCGRNLHGPDGILSVVETIDQVLPSGVKVHLFGVKGSALSYLHGNPRIESIDSMAWDKRAKEALGQLRRSSGLPMLEANAQYRFTNEWRMEYMKRWYERQGERQIEGEPQSQDDYQLKGGEK